MSYLVKLKNVNKYYFSSPNSEPVLKNISLTLSAGEQVAIKGPSGSGKSTLMNIIGLLDRASDGYHELLGFNVAQLSPLELAQFRNLTIGFVFQSFHLLPRLSALENVMLPLLYRRMCKKLAREKSYQLLKKMQMDPWINQKPNQLSGGQQQRIAIARALVGDPKIILADEPTGALDSKNSQLIMDLLFELKTTLLVITHDPVIYQRFPRVITLSDGVIMA